MVYSNNDKTWGELIVEGKVDLDELPDAPYRWDVIKEMGKDNTSQEEDEIDNIPPEQVIDLSYLF